MYGPLLWNDLPKDLRNTELLFWTFCKHLKTQLLSASRGCRAHLWQFDFYAPYISVLTYLLSYLLSPSYQGLSTGELAHLPRKDTIQHEPPKLIVWTVSVADVVQWVVECFLSELKRKQLKHEACRVVRSNFLGTHFTTYDSGESPSRVGFITDSNNVRRELVAVTFVRHFSIISMLCSSIIGS